VQRIRSPSYLSVGVAVSLRIGMQSVYLESARTSFFNDKAKKQTRGERGEQSKASKMPGKEDSTLLLLLVFPATDAVPYFTPK
jgi:hypothetical protein